jgi:hypothetical protein
LACTRVDWDCRAARTAGLLPCIEHRRECGFGAFRRYRRNNAAIDEFSSHDEGSRWRMRVMSD